ncbi:MAG: hypothetical protein RLZZ111_2120 [Planctomycetota bacterium]|jgi:hypothetical protein
MANRSKSHGRRDRDDDTSESLKPLVVLVLLGTILYGAWSVVSKGPSATLPAVPEASPAELATAPAFAPQVEIPGTAPALSSPQTTQAPAFTGSQGGLLAGAAAAPPVALPAAQAPPVPPEVAAAPTYLSAAAAPPPVADADGLSPPLPGISTTASAASAAATGGLEPPTMPPPAAAGSVAPVAPRMPTAPNIPAEPATSAPAFASAWSDAHDKLAAGRYAEALAVLSTWHDDPTLGLEESQRLEDLLGQLAGTVIYSQQDLLLPPHVVAEGETLQSIAAPLAVPWQMLAKINGVADPARLVPGESLKVVRGPFDAVVSISRRRLSLRVGGSYAGSFPVVVGRSVRDHVGTAVPVLAVQGNAAAAEGQTVQAAWSQPAIPGGKPAKSIALAGGLAIEAVADPATVSDDAVPSTSLVVSERDLADLADILGQGSTVLLRQ